ncbi:hypothetical protein ABK040_007991 [Willaertia magna]
MNVSPTELLYSNELLEISSYAAVPFSNSPSQLFVKENTPSSVDQCSGRGIKPSSFIKEVKEQKVYYYQEQYDQHNQQQYECLTPQHKSQQQQEAKECCSNVHYKSNNHVNNGLVEEFIDTDIIVNEYNQERIQYEYLTQHVYPNLKSWYCIKHRQTLCDWFLDIVNDKNLTKIIPHIAISYVDKYLSLNPTFPNKFLQLLGAACFWITCKREEKEESLLSVRELIEYADNSFTKQQLLNTEIEVLRTLNWSLSSITPHNFLHFYLFKTKSLNGYNQEIIELIRQCSEMFLETLLLGSFNIYFYPPSAIAASILGAVLSAYNVTQFPFVEITGYEINSIVDCITILRGQVCNVTNQ